MLGNWIKLPTVDAITNEELCITALTAKYSKMLEGCLVDNWFLCTELREISILPGSLQAFTAGLSIAPGP